MVGNFGLVSFVAAQANHARTLTLDFNPTIKASNLVEAPLYILNIEYLIP